MKQQQAPRLNEHRKGDKMAVKLEFINVIIPIKNIERCASIGGFKGFLEMTKGLLDEIDWYDEYLYRTGVMNPLDMVDIVEDWRDYGLVPVRDKAGVKKWGDLCVIDTSNGLTLPCDWIEVDLKERCAWLKGTAKGKRIGRKSGETYEGVVLG